jgi:alpha-L-rhamnosidase
MGLKSSMGSLAVLLMAMATAPSLAAEDGSMWGAGDAWIDVARAQVLTPTTDRMTPVAVQRQQGAVESTDALLAEDGRSARLTYPEGGAKPVVVLDFGAQSVGGYAVFRVTAKTGEPVVRLSYACHPDGTGETGDFTRETSARYMGPAVDLPVLPANINRHETYTIPRTGVFIAPLIQGQTRYVRVQLDRPGTSVDIDSVVMVNREVHDRSPYDGLFLCSNEQLNRLWYISVWTYQIASFPNHDAWRAVDGWLLPRKLEQAPDIGLSVNGADWRDVLIETVFEIRANPHHVSAAGLAFRARDAENAYMVELALDGKFRLVKREKGQDKTLSEKTLAAPLTDGMRYRLKVSAKGDLITTWLDDVMVDETRDATFPAGRVGFYTPKEKWPLFDFIRVADHRGHVLLEDDFTGDLSRWDFARTLSFVSDGAKRDRLVWSGDLYFAQRNEYYAMPNASYMRDSLKMLAFNQTPEGYVHACPYPERNTPPASGEYGPFASDEFAAWLVPVAWDHLLYTDDVETLREIYPAIVRLLAYLEKHTGEDGLFIQRYETSKQAGDLKLGNVQKRAYMNILCWGAFSDAAKIADRLGHADDAAAARARADKIKAALFQHLWDGEKGGFRESVETPRFGPEANALALSMGLLTQEQAARVAPRMPTIKHGKFQGLASRGIFHYGFGQRGLKAIFDHNWLKLLDPGWQGATTTTECMFMLTRGWFDESHPDTAIGYQFSSYILGIEPLTPGFRRFQVRPTLVREVDWVRGRVPTPHGFVEAGWKRDGTTLKMLLTVPKGTEAELVLPKGEAVLVNGQKPATMLLSAGRYDIEVRGLTATGVLEGAEVKDVAKAVRKVTASSSHERGGWSTANLFAPEGDGARLGYSSAAHNRPEAEVWLAMDLGEEITPKEIVLLPRRDTSAADGRAAGFPRDFVVEIATEPDQYRTVAEFTDQAAPDEKGLAVNLYTVIGYPKVRYIRIRATHLGAPAANEPDTYRLQLRRVRVVQ